MTLASVCKGDIPGIFWGFVSSGFGVFFLKSFNCTLFMSFVSYQLDNLDISIIVSPSTIIVCCVLFTLTQLLMRLTINSYLQV